MNKKVIFVIIKILFTIIALPGGLIALTNWRLNGIHIFGWDVSAEQVNMFVESSGSYLYLAYAATVILIIWGIWIGRRAVKKTNKEV